jgi:A/G-specific adenine glycosylase
LRYFHLSVKPDSPQPVNFSAQPLAGSEALLRCFQTMRSRNSPVKNPAELCRFRRQLLSWFDENKRDLPWRASRDAYRVWLSEIMLQQTRVAAAVDHFEKFLQRFPSVQHLARARESSVLAAWSGLGYYRRARMLHAAAKKVVNENGGKFPATAGNLRELPGIGRYTAAAIASIVFDEAVAVVDGNVERVLQRMTGKNLSRDATWEAAEIFLDPARPGDFNQAMMELGATVCLPQQPKCLSCPVREFCATRGEHPRPTRVPRQQKLDVYYSLNLKGSRILLIKRPHHASLMAGMWELPAISNLNGHQPWATLRHSITHTDYRVHVVRDAASTGSVRWIERARLSRLPLTGLARKILRTAKIL